MTAPRRPLFSSDYRFDILVCLGLVLAIFIPYHQVAGHRFIEFDDGVYTFYNTHIIKGLRWESVCWAFTNTDSANWHPLTWISHLVDRELFLSHPGAYLLENVAWHALASCLCYVAFHKVTGNRLFGFIVALIFAVHPANVENVAWASERKSLLNAAFWFCAMITYVDFLKTRSFRAYGFTAIAYMLSLLSKPMSVTLPCTLVLVHALYLVYHPDQRDGASQPRQYLKRLLLPALPLFALAAYFGAVTLSAQSMAMPTGYPLQSRLINAVLSYERYLEMFFHPTGLAAFYPIFVSDLTLRAAIPALLVLSAITAVVLLLIRKKPQLLIGWCWFLGTLVPVIGLVQVGSQSHADRYLYIPMLGLAFVFPVLFEALRSLSLSARRAVTAASLGVLGASMILATQIQVSYWKDGVTLFRHSLAVTGDCVTSVFNLVVAYGRTERFEEMVAYVDSEIAVAQNPLNKGKLAALKAMALYALKKHELAIASAKQAIEWGDTKGSAYWTMAASNYELGNLDESARCLVKAKAVHTPANETNLIEVQLDRSLTTLEALLKEKASAKEGRHPPTAPEPTASSRRD